jgi:hypothetical protein
MGWKLTGEDMEGCVSDLTVRLTDAMEQSPFWQSNSSSASQEIPSILWNPKVYYRFSTVLTDPYPEPDESTPRFLILSWIRFNATIPSAPRSSKHSLFLRFPYQKFVCFSFLTNSCHILPFHLITLLIFGEEQKIVKLLIMQLFRVS